MDTTTPTPLNLPEASPTAAPAQGDAPLPTPFVLPTPIPVGSVTARRDALRAHFAQDVEDLLQRLRGALRTLSAKGMDADALVAALHSVRALRDAARYVGQTEFYDVAFRLEGALGAARGGQLTFSPETMALLVAAHDLLTQLANLETTETGRVPRIIAALDRAAHGTEFASPLASAVASEVAEPAAPKRRGRRPRAAVESDAVVETVPGPSPVVVASAVSAKPPEIAPASDDSDFVPSPFGNLTMMPARADVTPLLSALGDLGVHLQQQPTDAEQHAILLRHWRDGYERALRLRQADVFDMLRDLAERAVGVRLELPGGGTTSAQPPLFADDDVLQLIAELLAPALAAVAGRRSRRAATIRLSAQDDGDIVTVRLQSAVAPPVLLTDDLRHRMRALRGDLRLAATPQESVLTLRFAHTPTFAKMLLFRARTGAAVRGGEPERYWAVPLASLLGVAAWPLIDAPQLAALPAASFAQLTASIPATDAASGASDFALENPSSAAVLILGFDRPEALLLVGTLESEWEGEVQPLPPPVAAWASLFCGVTVLPCGENCNDVEPGLAHAIVPVVHVPEATERIMRRAETS